MTWQEVAVALLVTLCVVRVGLGIRSFFGRARKGDDPCRSCTCDCEVRRQFREKQAKCCEKRGKVKKNCCG